MLLVMTPIKFSNVFLVNSKDEVLVLRRTAGHPTRPLALDFPGGLLNAGESYAQAAVRELREETGVSIQLKDLEVIRHKRRNYPERILAGAVYKAVLPAADISIALSNEHDEYYWIKPAHLKNLPEFHQASLDYALENRFLD